LARRIKKRVVILFYTVMILAAVLWDILDGESRSLPLKGKDIAFYAAAGYGLALALIVIAVSILLNRISEKVRNLSKEIKNLIGDISSTDIWVFSIASGTGEEMLFRGPLLYHFGIVPSTIIFAALHGLFDRKLLLWTAFAFVVGLGLSYLCLWTGGIFSPVIAHCTINVVNLYLLKSEKMEG
jgi:membrane protease YdiL (CAAX protease family)